MSMSATLQRSVLGRPDVFDMKKSHHLGLTSDSHSETGLSEYTDSIEPTEEPNIYERIQNKRLKSQKTKKKTVHFVQEIA